MKRAFLCLSLLLAVAAAALSLNAAQKEGAPEAALVLEDFSKGSLGAFPAKWQERIPGGDKIYRLAEETGRRHLAADDCGQSVQVMRRVKWDIEKYPRLG
jgi:hypothetical protein